MSRGDIVAVVPGHRLGNKPRPCVIIQADAFDATLSLAACPFTTDPTNAVRIRLPVDPTPVNGLRERSWIMIDRIISVHRDSIGRPIGRLSDSDMTKVDRALIVFLGLAS